MNSFKNEYLNKYMKINEKMIFITNSKIRLKILTVLFEEDLTMKEINKETSLSYSSISTNIGKLEKEGYVFRENSNYYLSNEIRLYLINLLDFNDSLLLVINNFFDFFLYHNINNLNLHSIEDLYLLKNAKLIENDGYDVYKTYNTIKNIIINGEKVKIILPFLYANFIDVLSKALSKNIEIEIILPRNISLKIKKCINSSKKNLKLIETHEDIEFSLFLSATNMAFGLFKDDGYYDQNRLLIANDENSLIWAENLFENFKKEN